MASLPDRYCPVSEEIGRRADGFLVVLDDDHRVAEVAQLLERADQPGVVALVQPDRGLVQHVHDAGQPRADLAGEADALRLAPGERFRRALERQVVEPDVDQELQPRRDLAHDALGDLLLGAFQLQGIEEIL
jgi:hypothetical protein